MASWHYSRRILAWSIAASLATVAASTAMAQDAAAKKPADTAAETNPDGSPKVTKLNEIKVSAQKREEYLQDVPLTMATLNRQQLHDAGVRDIKDLQILVPDLVVTSTDSTANTTARIRGVGTTGDNAGLESSVGVVIDGVPRARVGVGFGDLGEINQIEVLKGPQGTVFGKNTTAGVIDITTQRPTFTEQGSAEFDVGNYRAAGVSASYSNKITDWAAFRVYVADRQHNGYNDVFVNQGPRTETHDDDQNFHSFRGQLLLKPTKDVDINIIGDYTQRNENCCVAVTTHRDPGIAALTDVFAGGPGLGVIPSADPSRRLAYANSDTTQKITDKGVSAEVNWNTPWLNNATLTSITSVRQWNLESASDLDFNGANLAIHDFSPNNGERFNTFSQELRYAGSTDHVDWMGGVYFDNVRLQRSEQITEQPQYEGFLSSELVYGIAAALPPGLFSTANPQNFFSQVTGAPYGQSFTGVAQRDQWNQNSKSEAAFGNATWHITDAFSLTGGMRYTHEQKKTDFRYDDPNGGLGCGAALTTTGVGRALIARGLPASLVPLVAPTVIGNMCLPWQNPLFNGLNVQNNLTESNWSGTLKAAYRFSDQMMVYLSGARGYKAGGYNLARVQSANGQVGGGSGVIPVTDTSFPAEAVNSFELGTKTTWADGNLLINAALFHSRYTNYQLNTFSGISWVVDSIPQLTTQGLDADVLWQTPMRGLTLQAAATYTKARFGNDVLADPTLVNVPGSTPGYAPRWSASSGVTYQWDMGSRLFGRFNVNAKYSGDYLASGLPDPLMTQKSYTLVGARFTVGDIGKHWTVELWGQNLTNRTYVQAYFDPALQTGSENAFLGDPRTFGVTLRASL
nr:TonB-dependent receptor [Luteibacter rhizovicinus]